ncbi:MAG: hypothetical protein E7551_02415 [Ruminococcaceae bacterium]|nr:hypothetical protein [Oscillospiraceae bacterium]
MFNFSIMGLDETHIDEHCEDIKKQYENGTASMVLFSIRLVPEGDPLIPKAQQQCEVYAKFKAKLDSMGLKSGILVQCTLGHGYPLNKPSKLTRIKGLTNGVEENAICPFDKDFREYLRHSFSVVASYNPDHIMLDDDFRLIIRPGKGCACDLHLDAFYKKTGIKKSREEILAYVMGETEEDAKMRDAFVETQLDSLRECVKFMRAGIDEVNPAIQGSFCCVGPCCEAATEIATTMAGKGNPVLLRINNGNYHPVGTKEFSNNFLRAAVQMAVLKGQGKVDNFLAETDTCPQNRYSTGAMSLHAHFVGTILEGVSGAKHWITRGFFEPKSGRKYREVLGKYNKFYEALSDIVPTLSWRGARIPVSTKPDYMFKESTSYSGWGAKVLERLGIPMYFSTDNNSPVTFLDGGMDSLFTDDEIKIMLGGTLVLDGGAAENLCKRGFADLLGVMVNKNSGKIVSGEFFVNDQDKAVTRQTNSREIKVLNDEVKTLTYAYHLSGGVEKQILFPASTLYKNSLGGAAIVFGGDANTKFHYTTAFGFLNETRKNQFIELLKAYGDLPVYTPDDDEIYLKAADMPDGSLFCALFNVSLDPVDNIRLCLDKKPSKISFLDLDGEFKEVTFKAENGEYILEKRADIITPVILKVEY